MSTQPRYPIVAPARPRKISLGDLIGSLPDEEQREIAKESARILERYAAAQRRQRTTTKTQKPATCASHIRAEAFPAANCPICGKPHP